MGRNNMTLLNTTFLLSLPLSLSFLNQRVYVEYHTGVVLGLHLFIEMGSSTSAGLQPGEGKITSSVYFCNSLTHFGIVSLRKATRQPVTANHDLGTKSIFSRRQCATVYTLFLTDSLLSVCVVNFRS